MGARSNTLKLALLAAGASAAVCAQAPSAAALTERAALHASFTPDRLGASTTIRLSFRLTTAEGAAPPPLTGIDLRMPAGLNYTSTQLGLALCSAQRLQAEGLAGCPANSRLGYGSALVEVPFGTGIGHEIPEVQAVAGPSKSGNLAVLFYANGLYPVSAQLAFAGELLPDSGHFGSQLQTEVPLVASVPGGPDVSIVSVTTTIGPAHLTYYRTVRGHRVAFSPRGVQVPEHCPHGGFPFGASFSFQDGSSTATTTTAPCPASRR
jgi:hypothetical protein